MNELLHFGKYGRNHAFKMSDSEIITILLLFHLSGYRTLRAFYTPISAKSGGNTFRSCSLTIALWNVSNRFVSNFICFSTTVVWVIAREFRSLIPFRFECVTKSDREGQNLSGICHKRQRDYGPVLRFQTAHHYQRPRRNRPMAVDTSQHG